MVMSWIFTILLGISCLSALITGNGSSLAAAVTSGAQAGITLAVSLAGALCLWTGIGRLMEAVGLTQLLARLIRPLLHRVFPGTKSDPVLAGHLSANICANFLGLGNAATPMGIRAVQRMAERQKAGIASDEMCRLIVLNTASIQLIPANVAAVRASLGCAAPFDILPAVWVTSLCSASLGVAAAWWLGKLWAHD
jgi:spore maturation protein A